LATCEEEAMKKIKKWAWMLVTYFKVLRIKSRLKRYIKEDNGGGVIAVFFELLELHKEGVRRGFIDQ
jgi:hypothetical protein